MEESADAAVASVRRKEAEGFLLEAEALLEKEVEVQRIEELSRKALKIYQDLGDQGRIADALRIVLHVLRYKDQRKEAARIASEQLEIFRVAGHQSGVAKMLLSLAEVNYDKRGSKNRELALQQAQDANEIFASLGDKRMQAYALLAHAHASHKNIEKSCSSVTMQHLQKILRDIQQTAENAAKLFEDESDRKGKAAALHVVSCCKIQVNDSPSAEEIMDEAVQIYQELGVTKMEAFEHNFRARWKLAQGYQEEALGLSQKAAQLYSQAGVESTWEAGALYTSAEVLVAQRRSQEAITMAGEARKRFRKQGDRQAEVHMALALLNAQRSNGESEEALCTAQETLQVVRKIYGCKRLAGRMELDVASLQLGERRVFRAKQAAERALQIFRAIKDTHEQAYALNLRSQIELELHQSDQALRTLEQQAMVFQEAGNSPGITRALLDKCSACVRSDRPHRLDEALAMAIEAKELAHDHGETLEEVIALRVEIELRMCHEQYKDALFAARSAKSLMKELADEGGEAFMGLLMGQAYVHLLMKSRPNVFEARGKDRDDAAVETSEHVHNEAMNALKSAAKLAEKRKARDLLASILTVKAQIYILADKPEDCLQAGQDAASILRQLLDLSGEGYALLLCSSAHVLAGNEKAARDTAMKCLELFAQSNDQDGKSSAEIMLDRREASQDAAEVVPQLLSPLLHAGGEETGDDNDFDNNRIFARVRQLAKAIIGEKAGDEIEGEISLFHIGLTSMSSAQLLEDLRREFPGTDLPNTLAFDLPTLKLVTDHIADAVSRKN